MYTIEKYLHLKPKREHEDKKDDSSQSLEQSDRRDARKYLTSNAKTPTLARTSNSTAITPAKLTRIMKQRQPYVMKSKEELLHEKIDALFQEKRKSMLHLRLRKLPMKPATQFAAVGDEYCLMKEIEGGHDPNSRDAYNGRTVLHEAAAGGHFNIVRFLLADHNEAYDIDLDKPTKIGAMTALHLAVEKGYRQIASLLITHGAQVNLQDSQGNTPLHLATSLAVTKLLFKYAVDPSIRNNKLQTPLESYQDRVPVEEHNREIIDVMRAREEARFLEHARQKARKEQVLLDKEAVRATLVNSGQSTVTSANSASVLTSPSSQKKIKAADAANSTSNPTAAASRPALQLPQPPIRKK